RLEPWIGENGRVNPAGELPELFERLIELAVCGGEERPDGFGVRAQARLDQPKLERQRDESLLGAVVQISLQAPALGVARLDDPDTRRRELPVGVGVRERLRNEPGEVGEGPPRARGQWVLARRARAAC